MSSFLTLKLVVLTTSMVFLAQTNVQQPRSQSELPLRKLKMESTKNIRLASISWFSRSGRFNVISSLRPQAARGSEQKLGF